MNNKRAYNTGCKNKCFTSIHCVDDTCPSAQYESICAKYGYDLASDMGLKMIKCSKCYYNTQQCTDCIFENTSDCYMCRKENHENTGQLLDKSLPRSSLRS